MEEEQKTVSIEEKKAKRRSKRMSLAEAIVVGNVCT